MPDNMVVENKYTAFISYNSKDNRIAKWLQKKLESYSLPSVIANEKGETIRSYDKKPRKFKIFRYVTDLVAQNLDDGLRRELDQSKYLIVICSPRSARAPWVKKEVQHFIESGKSKQIIPFIIEGTPYSNDENECFTSELKEAFPGGSALGVNIDDYGDDLWIFRKRKAVAKTVSLLLDLPNAYGFIWDRYRSAYIKTVVLRFILALGIFAVLLAAVLWVRNMEKPIDIQVEVVEEDVNKQLPSIKDIEVVVMIGEGNALKDTLASVSDKAVFTQIPGRQKNKPMKLMVKNIDCFEIDTVISVCEDMKIVLHRDPNRYGQIRTTVLKGHEPLCGVPVIVEGQSYETNNSGLLNISIPLSLQKETYDIQFGDYKGIIRMPCIGTSVVELKESSK